MVGVFDLRAVEGQAVATATASSLFVWLVDNSWCWFVLREKYCWLVVDGWFVLREKYCWLVADKPSEQAALAHIPRMRLFYFFA
jgi:hypothetical protein